MVTIVEPDPRWASEFATVAARLREATPVGVVRIDHIGSTSVPHLAAKDVIDVQITVEDEPVLEPVVETLATRGWRRVGEIAEDHRVPGLSTAPAEWRKLFLREPEGERRTNVHVRVQGRANRGRAVTAPIVGVRKPDTLPTRSPPSTSRCLVRDEAGCVGCRPIPRGFGRSVPEDDADGSLPPM